MGKKRLNGLDFYNRVKKIHGEKYIYEKMNYSSNREKVILTCPVHGDFEIYPSNLLKGSGCKKCSSDKNRKSQDFFISELKEIFGDKYLYDKVEYISDATKVKIICPVHGEFESRPNTLLKGNGCPKCRNKPLDHWIGLFKSVHGDKYSYKNVPYVLARSPISVTCLEHGDFSILPSNHANGVGCPECFTVHNKGTRDSFIAKAIEVHGNKYGYENVEYINSITHVSITCPVHGEFKQVPGSHLYGHGCPKCFGRISKPEFEIVEYIKSLGIPDDKILMSSSPNFMAGKQQLDIFIPEFNFAIEFNGSRWHSENLGKDSFYHFKKWKMCNDNNVILLTIWDFNWNNPIKKDIYLSKINHYLKMDKVIFARKCKILNINKDVAIDFIRENHLEGFSVPYKNSKYIGLEHNNEIVMVAIYGEFYSQSKKDFEWKLQRVCTLKGCTVAGGISKISKYIKNDIGNFVFQITLDTGGSISNFYPIDTKITLRYWWVNSSLELKTRNSTQVQLLKKNEDWVEGDSESSYMKRNGYYKVYDCGIANLIY